MLARLGHARGQGGGREGRMGAGTGVGGFLAAWAQGIRCFGEEDMRQWLLWLAHAEGRASWADLD
jgi:hypothetical protein